MDAAQLFLGLAPIFAALIAFILLATVGEWVKRNRMRRIALKELITELKQDKEYPTYSLYSELDDDAFRRFRRMGFFYEMKDGLQKDLRNLYAQIRMKNVLLVYYRDLGTQFVGIQFGSRTRKSSGRKETANTLLSILGLITKARDEINKQIDVVLPKLETLLIDP